MNNANAKAMKGKKARRPRTKNDMMSLSKMESVPETCEEVTTKNYY